MECEFNPFALGNFAEKNEPTGALSLYSCLVWSINSPNCLKRVLYDEQFTVFCPGHAHKAEKNSGIAFGIVGLDGRKCGWVVEQDFTGIFWSFFYVFVCLFVCLFVFALPPDNTTML